MGKKLKKAVKGIVKVASLGAIDGSRGGWLGGTKGITNALTLGASDALTPKVPTFDTSGLEDAISAQGVAAQNANVDLGLQNVVDTEVGGTAGALAAGGTRRRRGAGAGVAASLGINTQ